MFRIGQSTDIHQLVENRDLYLGGVKIEHNKGLLGHSDADVLLHAICEAIIGALGLGDLGKHFPDTDEKYKGICSTKLLEHVNNLMNREGYKIGNLDSTILTEKPKMAPHIMKMRQNVACILNTDISQVNIKATRGEKLGFIGKEEGIVAQAVVLLTKK